MSCQHTQLIHAYHDGELPAERVAVVESHLAGCAQCRELIDDLRRLTRFMAEVDLPPLSDRALNRMHGAWWAAQNARERGVRRLAGWLTAAAAAVLVLMPLRSSPTISGTDQTGIVWEDAVTYAPPVAPREDGSPELVQFAQWMANDLSVGERR